MESNLQGSGIINTILIKFGFIDQPLSMLHNHYAVILGVVYTYLPFMILPLYGYLVKFDLNLIDASSDLGAKPFKTFIKVIIPYLYRVLSQEVCWYLSLW
jgi:putrescine transport system permease protein